MLEIGRYKFGGAAVSMVAVFVALTACAVTAAFLQPETQTTLLRNIVVNEGMALLATLVYGIFAHFAVVIINKYF